MPFPDPTAAQGSSLQTHLEWTTVPFLTSSAIHWDKPVTGLSPVEQVPQDRKLEEKMRGEREETSISTNYNTEEARMKAAAGSHLRGNWA